MLLRFAVAFLEHSENLRLIRGGKKTVELTHLVVKWSAVRNQSEIETSLKMRGMSPFLFVKLVEQRRTQNHAKPAHRVRRSSGQPSTGTTWSAGVGEFGLALAILVGLAKKWCCAAFLYISCQPFFTTSPQKKGPCLKIKNTSPKLSK